MTTKLEQAEPVAIVKENPFCPEGRSDELTVYLPVGTKLYAAPVQQAEQKPVVFYRCNGCGHAYESFAPSSCDCMEAAGFSRIEYYSAPVRTKDLTDDEIMDLVRDECVDMRWPSTPLFIARAVIAADRRKNNANNNT